MISVFRYVLRNNENVMMLKTKNSVSIYLNIKGQKRQRFRIIHLIEFIQTNNFHIYSIFLTSAVYSECDLKV